MALGYMLIQAVYIFLKGMITLNNKLLRILQNKPYKFRVKDLYLNFNILAIPELHIEQLLYLLTHFKPF